MTSNTHPADCGSPEIVRVMDDFPGAPRGIFGCRTCGLRWAGHIQADIERAHGAVADSYAYYLSDLVKKQEFAKRQDHLRKLHRIHQLTGGRRLLDVGCGAGEFLLCAAGAGFHVCGVEPDPDLVAWARNQYRLRVRQGTLQSCGLTPGDFDLVTMNHVLEHISEPLKELEVVRNLLLPTGLLVVEVPVVDSLAVQLVGRRWRNYKPEHLIYFSERSLRGLMERAAFEIRHVERVGRTVDPQYAAHLLDKISPILGRLAAQLARSGGLSRARVTVNLGDLLTVYASPHQGYEATSGR